MARENGRIYYSKDSRKFKGTFAKPFFVSHYELGPL